MKKIIKKIKKVEVKTPEVKAEVKPEVKCEPCQKAMILETSTDFQGQGLVDLANKVNEIIRYLNK